MTAFIHHFLLKNSGARFFCEFNCVVCTHVVYNNNVVGTDTSDSNNIPQPIFGFDTQAFAENIATESRKIPQTFASKPEPTIAETATRKPLRTEPPGGTIKRTPSWLYFVIGYAIVMSILALWGWLRMSDRGHPLSNIPDFFGEYRKAQRDKVSILNVNFEMVPKRETTARQTALPDAQGAPA